MSSIDTQHLRAVCEGANPGEWLAYEDHGIFGVCYYTQPVSIFNPIVIDGTENDCKFIATFNPVQCLALLDRIAELDTENGTLRQQVQALTELVSTYQMTNKSATPDRLETEKQK